MVTYSELVRSPEVAAGPADPGRGRRDDRRRARCRTAARSAATSASPIRRTTSRRSSPRSARRSRSWAPTASARSTADEFFVGVYWTAVGEGELLTRVTVPALEARRRRRARGHHARRARHVHRERRGDRLAGRRARRDRLRLGACPSARRAVEERLARRRAHAARPSQAAVAGLGDDARSALRRARAAPTTAGALAEVVLRARRAGRRRASEGMSR